MNNHDPEREWDHSRGICSRNTDVVHERIGQLRRYVRYHAYEGLFRDYSDASSEHFAKALEIAWAVLLEFERTLQHYGLGYRQVWIFPSLVLVIHHQESQQWVTTRAHCVKLTQADVATCKLLCLLDALICFAGPQQPKDFERHIEAEAMAALNGSED